LTRRRGHVAPQTRSQRLITVSDILLALLTHARISNGAAARPSLARNEHMETLTALASRVRDKLTGPGPLDVYFGSLSGEARAEAEQYFFGRLRLSNGTWKTTWQHRLDDVNALVQPLLPRGRRLAVMDVAVSSGVSAAEWSEYLARNGTDHLLTAGDLTVSAFLMTIGRVAAVLWQDDGHALALQFRRYTLYLERSGRIVRSLDRPLRLIYALAMRLRHAGYADEPRRWAIRVRRVGLVSPRIAANRTIRVIRDDIAERGKFREEFDVCRAANILNRGYFTDDVLVVMATNLSARICPDGLIVVCRTVSDCSGHHVNRASVLRKHLSSLEVVARLNGGCEIEGLLAVLRPGENDIGCGPESSYREEYEDQFCRHPSANTIDTSDDARERARIRTVVHTLWI
jgi:hypothetical protein